mgnify:CR=1 FL=1
MGYSSYPSKNWEETMKIQYVYIAGPYSGNVAYNVRDALDTNHALIEYGFFPFCPHLFHFQDLLSPPNISYEDWLALGQAWLLKCDAVLRIEGESRGADREVALALEEGIPVFYSVTDLLADRLGGSLGERNNAHGT